MMPEPQFDFEGRVAEAMNEVLFLKQALYGMKELAEDYVTCPSEFGPCISQVELVEESLVDVFEHLPANGNEVGSVSGRPASGQRKARPGQKGKEPAADRRAPAGKGNGREARAARA